MRVHFYAEIRENIVIALHISMTTSRRSTASYVTTIVTRPDVVDASRLFLKIVLRRLIVALASRRSSSSTDVGENILELCENLITAQQSITIETL